MNTFAGGVEILVQGYDDDPRELADIESVRKFFAAVTLAWPKWWHFVGRVLSRFSTRFCWMARWLAPSTAR